MMHRATVVSVPAIGRADIVIPKLYRDSVLRDVQSAVEVSEGDRVIVADLAERAHVNDWYVVGFESQVGRWGAPYPHEHPLGQVLGLSDALASKAPVTSPWEYPVTHAAFAPASGTTSRLRCRLTPVGAQLSGRLVVAGGNVPRDTTVATLPNGYRPSFEVFFRVEAMGPASSNYPAASFQFSWMPDGAVRARQELVGEGGVYSFNATVPIP